MKTILTIDFDICMKEAIESYNHFPDNLPWEERFKTITLLRNLPFNAQSFQKIFKYMCFLFTKIDKNNVHFINQHHYILNYIDKNDKYIIINIDHHHDWCYKDSEFNNNIDKVNCGNWVKYLSDINCLEEYIWIKNKNSSDLINQQQIFKIYDIESCSLLNFSNIDEIYISLSPEFVPPYYYPLFYTLMDTANAIYNTHYEIEKYTF